MLPTDDDLQGMRWPLLEVARMLRLARLSLSLSGVRDTEAQRIAAHLLAAPQLPERPPDCAALGAAVSADPAQVAAVAALLIGRRLIEPQPGLSRLVLALPDPGRSRLADLQLAALAGQCCSLAAAAIYAEGRGEVRQELAAQRREDGRKGGAPKRFSDDDLLGFLAQWEASEGHRRGRIKAAGRHFDVTDTAIGRRLRLIAKKREATG